MRQRGRGPRQRCRAVWRAGSGPAISSPATPPGEKDFEEFYTERETLDLDRFASIGVIKNAPEFEPAKLELFLERIAAFKARGLWERDDLVELFHTMIPGFGHKEMGKFLDDKM
jgi:hypothetical protein